MLKPSVDSCLNRLNTSSGDLAKYLETHQVSTPLSTSQRHLTVAEDIYHSYLGLAALAIMKEPGIKSLDPGLCISIQQKEIIEQFRRSAAVPTRTYWKHGYCFSIREDDPDFENIMASSKKPQHA